MSTCNCKMCAPKEVDPNREVLPIGTLVTTIWGDIGRVVEDGGYSGSRGEYKLKLMGYGDTSTYTFVYYTNLKVVEDAPAEEEDDKPTLSERKNLLRTYIDKAYLKATDYDVRCLLSKIRDLMAGCGSKEDKWFWTTLTVSLTDPKKISYAPSIQLVDSNKRRRFCSWGKFLKGPAAQKGVKIEEGLMRKISHLVGQSFPDTLDYRFEIVSGEDIYTAYNDDSTSWDSCMTGEDFVRWYCDNPQTVSMVLIYQGEHYCGRSLLWNTQQGVRLLDRIYPSDLGPHIAALELYAETQGWDFRQNHNCDIGEFFSGREDYTVEMECSRWGYPYMDTFKYTNDVPIEGEMILNTRDGKFVLEYTDGNYNDEDYCYCESCDRRIYEDETYGDDGSLCEDCYNENYVHIEYKNSNGNWISGDYHREDLETCSECDEYVRPQDIKCVNDHDLCPACVKEVVKHCVECGENGYIAYMEEINEQYYCEDCYRERLEKCEDRDSEEVPNIDDDLLPKTDSVGTVELSPTCLTEKSIPTLVPVDRTTSTGEGILRDLLELAGF